MNAPRWWELEDKYLTDEQRREMASFDRAISRSNRRFYGNCVLFTDMQGFSNEDSFYFDPEEAQYRERYATYEDIMGMVPEKFEKWLVHEIDRREI